MVPRLFDVWLCFPLLNWQLLQGIVLRGILGTEQKTLTAEEEPKGGRPAIALVYLEYEGNYMSLAKKLNYKEYNELLVHMRRWVNPYRNEAAKLIYHIQFQLDEIKRLEATVRELEQIRLGFEKEKIMAPKPTPEPVVKPQKYPLGRRLAEMKVGSPEWLQALKWNRLTEEQALTLASEYENQTLDNV